MKRAVFLDRDDTLLVDSGYMSNAESVELCPGVPQALARLRRGGFGLVLISNQSGVARGIVTADQVTAIQERMCRLLPDIRFDGFEYCFHHPGEDCGCRKPSPAMILRAARRLEIDRSRSVMVGDRESDVQAGNAAGCWSVLVGSDPNSAADHQAPDLAAAADWILALGEQAKRG